MEEKIFKNQVTKRQLAARVIDDHMPENAYTEEERAELFSYDFENGSQPIDDFKLSPSVSNDQVLKGFVEMAGGGKILSAVEEDFFLEDREDEHLNDEELRQAEDEYEKELQAEAKRNIFLQGIVEQNVKDVEQNGAVTHSHASINAQLVMSHPVLGDDTTKVIDLV
jgi:hypothetical protein